MRPTPKTKTFRRARAQDGRKALDAYRNVLGYESLAEPETALAKISALTNLSGVLAQLVTHEMGYSRPSADAIAAREAVNDAYTAMYRLMHGMQKEVGA